MDPGGVKILNKMIFFPRFPFLIKKKKKVPKFLRSPGKKIPVCVKEEEFKVWFLSFYFLCLSILSMVLLVSAGLWSPAFMYVLSAIFNASFR